MRQVERFPPSDPREWLNRAASNLRLAKNRVPGVYLEDLCFEAQQAAEKAVKAVMIVCGVDFPYVHSLEFLLSTLEREADETIPNTVRSAAKLTPYAVDTRYPGFAVPVEEEEYMEAVEIAEAVMRWAEEIVRRS